MYIYVPLKDGKFKDWMNKIRPWLAKKDYYKDYSTTRAAWFTRGTMLGIFFFLFLSFTFLFIKDFSQAFMTNSFSWKTPLIFLVDFLYSFFVCVFAGLNIGSIFGMIEPPNIKYDNTNPEAVNILSK